MTEARRRLPQPAKATKRPTTKAPAVTRAVIYVRMSLDKTGEGAGLERQEESCRSLAKARGWDVIDVVEDTISATKFRMHERDGWQRVLGMMERGEIDMVVAWHLDRITRSTRDLIDLIDLVVKHGVGIATTTGDIDLSHDSGRLMAKILAAVAEGETERKAARQVLANQQRAAAGRQMWVRRPFGYNKDGTAREDEAKLVRQAYADLLNGKSLSAICRDWDASGFTPSGGAQSWGLATVRTLLRSPRNAALSTYQGQVVAEAGWDALVEESTWRAADRLLADPSRKTGGGGPLANLLTGIAVCDVCEGRIRVLWRGRKGEEGSYAIYQCVAGHASLPVQFADDVAVWHLLMRAPDLDATSFVPQVEAPDLGPLRTEEADLRGRLDALAEDFADGLLDRAAMLAGTAKLRQRLNAVEAEIAKTGRVGIWTHVDIEALADQFMDLTLETKREILRAAFGRIAIKSRGKGRVPPRPSLLAVRWTPEWRKPTSRR